MTTTPPQDSRADFEAAYAGKLDLTRFGPTYESGGTSIAWEAWQASRIQAMKDAAKIAEESQKGDGRAQARSVTARSIAAAIRAAAK